MTQVCGTPQEAILREWLGQTLPSSGAALVLSRDTLAGLLADVDAARASRPVVQGAPVPQHQLDREAAQLAADGAE